MASSHIQKMSTDGEAPPVSVIVCTRNRKDNVISTVRAVLASDYANLELLIMDQSEDDSTSAALVPLCQQDSRLRYFRQQLPGKPRALNHARMEAHGQYFVLTDDDCEPEATWVSALVAVFQNDPRIGGVFGDVVAAPHDSTQGFISENRILAAHTIGRVREFLKMPYQRNFGIGANMALRAEVLAELEGWDPCIGPGSKFGSGDDHDLAVRILVAGYPIHFCPEARVVHYGFRRWEHMSQDMQRIGFGFGATFIKELRCGTLYYGSLRMLRYFVGQTLSRALRRRAPLGLALPRGWLRGVIAGFRYPLNKRTRQFYALDDAESRAYGQHFARVVLRAQQSQVANPPPTQEAPPVKQITPQ